MENTIPYKTTTVRIPMKLHERAEKCVADGFAVNFSDLVRVALEQKLRESGY